ncbi:MAG TPA: GAF domain-containing protein [Desulfomicrobiaceae bacterium]|nr:GAF domain-containing protein [Desulfomicrobiaceae bacterium]
MNKVASLDKILAIVSNIFDAYTTVLFWESGKSRYELCSSFSLGDNVINGTLIEPGQGLVGWVLRHDKPLLVKSVEEKKNFLGYYEPGSENKIKAFLGVPLPDGKGVLCVDSKKTYSFSTKDQKILGQFAEFIGSLQRDFSRVGLSRQEHRFYTCLKLIHLLREETPRWGVFLDRFLALLSEYSGFQYCFLAARDERGWGYSVEGSSRRLFGRQELEAGKFPIGSGVVGWIFKHNQAVFSEELEFRPAGTSVFGKDIDAPPVKTVMAFPLRVHRVTRGVLVFADAGNIHLSSEMRTFGQMIAEHLALFLENLYLKNRLNQQSGLRAPGASSQH